MSNDSETVQVTTGRHNPYYSPEKLGLVVIGEIEFSDACWQFETRIFWKTMDGRVYTARDAGCSCPEPFEDYYISVPAESPDLLYAVLDLVTTADVSRYYEEIRTGIDSDSETSMWDAGKVLRKVEAVLKEAKNGV